MKQAQSSVVGLSYVRWGKPECQFGSTMLYEGFMGGAFYDHMGGGSNYLCLPYEPKYVYKSAISSPSRIYTTEFETNNEVFPSETQDYDTLCAVCFVEKATKIMLPAELNCPFGWSLEYDGYLMSSHYKHESNKDYVCVDSDPDVWYGSGANDNGALLYFVTVDCNASFMSCGPYQDRVPLNCAVCTR